MASTIRQRVLSSVVKPAGRVVMRTLTATRPARSVLREITTRARVPVTICRRMPAEGLIILDVPGGGLVHYEVTFGDSVGFHLYWRGLSGFEPETIPLFVELARTARGFADVGANTGYFSLLAAAVNPDVDVVAFEPGQYSRDRLRRNLALNHFERRCEVRREALCDETGEATFYMPGSTEQADAAASLSEEIGWLPGAVQVTVPVTTFDRAWADRGPCDLVKLDVEGGEDRGLRGMHDTLNRHRPSLIVECNPGGPHARIEQLLRPLGYRAFHLLPDGPKQVDRVEPDPQFRFRNVLFSCATPPRVTWGGR